MPRELELFCPHCQAIDVCGPHQMLARLRSVAALRREAEPDLDLLVELFRCSAGKFACQSCDRTGLQMREPVPDTWETARTCVGCATRIPAERLELFPKAQKCASCEAAADQNLDGECEFCRKCGEVLTLRLRQGAGIAKYEMTCPRCRG